MNEQNRPQVFKVYNRDAIVNDHVIAIDLHWETIVTRDEKRNIYRVFDWSSEDEDMTPRELDSYEKADSNLYNSILDILIEAGAFTIKEKYDYNVKKDKERAESRRLNDIAQL